MWMDSDGTCAYNLIDELFIIENEYGMDSQYTKPCKTTIRVCTLFSQKDMYINTFQLGGGGHIVFINFEAFAGIFELGIQTIWAQNPSIPLQVGIP